MRRSKIHQVKHKEAGSDWDDGPTVISGKPVCNRRHRMFSDSIVDISSTVVSVDATDSF